MIYPYETCVSLAFLPYKTPRKQGKRKAKFHFLLYHAKVLLFLLKYHWFLCKLHNKKTLIQRDASEIYHLYKIKVFILSFLHSKISMGYKDLSPAANLNPSNLCVFIEQMCITTQKFFKKKIFLHLSILRSLSIYNLAVHTSQN